MTDVSLSPLACIKHSWGQFYMTILSPINTLAIIAWGRPDWILYNPLNVGESFRVITLMR